MKRMSRFVICLMLIVSLISALSIHSMAILTPQLKYVYDSGDIVTASGVSHHYSTVTSASTTFASATLTYEKATQLYAHINAALVVQNNYEYNQISEAVLGYEVYISTTNIFYDDGVPLVGEIKAAIATYRIGTHNSFTSTVS